MANQEDMAWLPGGQFRMGSDTHYGEEAPAHEAMVSGFWIDRTPVTNRHYAAFVEATNYVTIAELTPRAEDYPGALPEMLKPASLVFVPTSSPVRLDDWSQWWQWTFGADWQHPTGPGSNLDNLWDHPVVHVALADVEAYAAWAGKQLPTETEWEYAGWAENWAHEFAWGDELEPDGKHMANVWQGNFPYENSLADGFLRTSPVGSFSPNRFGLYDMIGNVWEWTADWYTRSHVAVTAKACCVPSDTRNAAKRGSQDPNLPAIPIPRRVLKGGSHLCAPNYCRRYRPAARHAQPIDSAASHIGFRCVRRVPKPTE